MVKQIVIVSGKGGTGKTVISAAFSTIIKNKIMVDADVDAADLFLLLHPIIRETHKFSGGSKAVINPSLCKQCGVCRHICRFDAVSEKFIINDILCEGCGLCAQMCPNHAIKMYHTDSGEWYVSDTKTGVFIHAQLGIAEENSGKLVSLIKQKTLEIAEQNSCDWIIIDGPPGIGCPAIAALGNSDGVVVVTEPTLPGLHDAMRITALAQHFRLPIKFLINKYDLNVVMTEEIENFCRTQNIDVLGKIAFDENVVRAVMNGKTIMDQTEFKGQEVLLQAWEKIENTMI